MVVILDKQLRKELDEIEENRIREEAKKDESKNKK